MTAPDSELAELLNDGAWLRRFVRTLVPAQEVDDLVQTTWLAALQRRIAVRSPRQWMNGVAANLGRMLHRQRGRKERTLQGRRGVEAEVPTVDVVAGLEVQRAISEALLELPEPTRTILVLRYQEGVEAAVIAGRLGLQAPAVRQRLHRGRELVRAKLRQRFGPDWRGCAGVLAFAGSQDSALATAPAAPSAAIAAAALLLVGGLAAAGWLAAMPADIEPPEQPRAVATVGDAARDLPMSQEPGAATRTPVVGPEQDPAKPAAIAAIEVRGRIVAAEDGSPLAEAKLEPRFLWRDEVAKVDRHDPETIVTAVDGRFVVRCPAAAVSLTLWIRAEGRCVRWYDPDPPCAIDLGDVPLTRGYSVRGRLVDETGQPMEGVFVETPIDGNVAKGGAMGFPNKTTADGSFTGRELVPAGSFEFCIETPGVELVDATVDIVAKPEPNFVVLRGRRLPSIRGVVFGPDGAPCPGVQLEALDPAGRALFSNCGSGHSAADGSFEVFRNKGESSVVRVTASRTAAHEVVTELPPCPWGTSGLRLEVRPLIPVRLRVLEAGTRTAVERFGAFTIRQIGGVQVRQGDNDMTHHDGGLRLFEGLAPGSRIVLWAADALLPPVQVIVEESMRTAVTVDVEIARLQSFALTLVDMRGHPLAVELHVVDRCGATEPGLWSDPRSGLSYTGNFSMRLSSASTDADGKAMLMAPTDRRDLVVALRRGDRDVWVPLALPAVGRPIRLIVPD